MKHHNCGAPPAALRCNFGCSLHQVLARARQPSPIALHSCHEKRRCLSHIGGRSGRDSTLQCTAAASSGDGAAAATTAAPGLRTLYPASGGPHASGWLDVTDGHRVYWEARGNPQGRPALFVHGGPGAGCFPNHARFFDPQFYRVVLVDQRGCGRSTPRGGLEGNTTQALVADFEALRRHLGVERWLVLGGSWGVALALAYSIAHPQRVTGVVLRGVCLMRRCEVDWLFRGGGIQALQPRAWAEFLAPLTPEERADPVAAYYARMTSSPDASTRAQAARAWSSLNSAAGMGGRQPVLQAWEPGRGAWQTSEFPPPPGEGSPLDAAPLPPPPTGSALGGSNGNSNGNGSNSSSSNGSNGNPAAASSATTVPTTPPTPPPPPPGPGNATVSSSAAAATSSGAATAVQPLLEAHYCHHDAFLADAPLLERVHVLREAGVPCIAVQGRLDLVTPVRTAWDLHTAWPEMELRVVPLAGHSMYEPGITHELVCATDRMRLLPPERWEGPGIGGGSEDGSEGDAVVAAGGGAGGASAAV